MICFVQVYKSRAGLQLHINSIHSTEDEAPKQECPQCGEGLTNMLSTSFEQELIYFRTQQSIIITLLHFKCMSRE